MITSMGNVTVYPTTVYPMTVYPANIYYILILINMLKIAFKLHCLCLDPEFPLQMWNILDRDSTGFTRTTNALEAYHYSFDALISCQHPTILRTSKLSQVSTNLRGCSFRLIAARNKRIQDLIDSYIRAYANRLLRGIAYIV